MFRPISLLCKNRAIPLKRFYCKPKEKYFIIKAKDEGKKVVYGSQILQKFREQIENEKQVQSRWMQLMEIVRRLMMKSQQQSMELIKSWDVKEKMLQIKKSQVEKINRKILNFKENNKMSEIPGRATAQLEVIKASDGFKRFINIPNEVACYWVIFMKSKTRDRLEEIIVWMWIEWKIVTMKIIKFIREAYFDKPVKPKAIEKK